MLKNAGGQGNKEGVPGGNPVKNRKKKTKTYMRDGNQELLEEKGSKVGIAVGQEGMEENLQQQGKVN